MHIWIKYRLYMCNISAIIIHYVLNILEITKNPCAFYLISAKINIDPIQS